jgi:perosamine synthetase
MEKNKKRLYGNEKKYLLEVLEHDFRSTSSAGMVTRLETLFAQRFGVKYAISFVNGTATMHAALEAMGIGPGDEVIVPPLTMSATTFAVLQANATPVFADVDPDTYQICVKSVASRITKNTKAVIPVALYGLAPDMPALHALCGPRKIRVIEDNAECFLGEYNGKIVGSESDCASFSFQSSKHVTSGEGGMLVTNDLDLAEKVRRVNSLGYAGVGATKVKINRLDIQNPDYSRHVCMGWNYRMPELCAAVALAQMENIDWLVNRRIEVGELFNSVAEGSSVLKPQHNPPGYKNSYWTWVAEINRPEIKWHEFRDRFLSFGGDSVYAAWKLTYMEPMFTIINLLGRDRFISDEVKKSYAPGLCPVAERLQPRLLQFKTNYWDFDRAEKQAEILAKTLKSFS